MPRILFFLTFFALLLNACVSDEPTGTASKKSIHETSAKKHSNVQKTYRVNVFIENSISMDGYVNKVNSFKQAIYALVADLQSSHRVRELNFYYLNNFPLKGKLNASQKDAYDFINQLTPTVFRKNAKAGGSSDLKTNLEIALQKVDTASASIFISDCIFSPGSKQKASDFLMTQETGIKTSFKAKLDSVDFTTQILHYKGLFNGAYFDQNNQLLKINSLPRPYYMIAMGPAQLLAELLNEQNLQQYKSRGYIDDAILSAPSGQKVSAKMIYKYHSGQFTIEAPASRLVISEATPSAKGELQFAVAADLSQLGNLPKNLKTDLGYELTPGCKLDSIISVTDTTEKSIKGMTHVFIFAADALKQSQDISFTLFRQTPDWVKQTSVDDDRSLLKDDHLDRTFGLRFLVNGINSAYTMAYHQQKLLQLQIQVNTTEAGVDADSSSFSWLLLIIPALLVLLIIIIKNKK